MLIQGPEELLVDLASDSAPGRPAMASIAGPMFAPAELAGRKVIALFDRAAAHDFVAVFALSRRLSKTELIALAREVDVGFGVGVFVEMIGLLSRYSDVDLDLGDVNAAAVRAFFADWSAELERGRERGLTPSVVRLVKLLHDGRPRPLITQPGDSIAS